MKINADYHFMSPLKCTIAVYNNNCINVDQIIEFIKRTY